MGPHEKLRRVLSFESLESRETPDAGVSFSTLKAVTTELGQVATVGAWLTAQPTAKVTLALTLPAAAAKEGTLSRTRLTFTPSNWDRSQTFTITGKNDSVVDPTKSYVIGTKLITSDAEYKRINPRDVAVVNRSADVKLVRPPGPFLLTNEAGRKATVTVSLMAAPLKSVTMAVTVSDPTEGSANKSKLIFTPTNWKTPQALTVVGKNDTVADGAVTHDLKLSFSSEDGLFNNRSLSVAVRNEDNDGFPNGTYAGSFLGTVTAPVIGTRNVNAAMEFTVNDGLVTVTKPGPGTGIVTSNGSTNGEIRPTTSTFNGLILPAGISLSNVVVKFKRVGLATGTWRLTGRITIPFLGAHDFTGSGSWTANKV